MTAPVEVWQGSEVGLAERVLVVVVVASSELSDQMSVAAVGWVLRRLSVCLCGCRSRCGEERKV